MMRMRSMNPVFRHTKRATTTTSEYVATYSGVISKTAFLLAIMIGFGGYSMVQLMEQQTLPGWTMGALIAAPIVALISIIIAMRRPGVAKYFAVIYAICQGTFLGVISGVYEIYIGDHIVATALIATMTVFAVMLGLYASGLVRVTDLFRRVLFTALIGLFFTSFILLFLSIGGVFSYGDNVTFIFAIVVISVIVASLFLLVDFDNIKKVVNAGADKQYEWVLSLGLLVTVVWLYVELLRLIAILRRR